MAPLKILICGGGCAGPALAFWLARAGYQVTVVERFPALRATGAQIDLRAQGIEVAKRMGLLDAIRSQLVDEEGVNIVDTSGGIWATIMANKSGQGAQSLTSEFEIMRGDLVLLLYNATQNDVQYIFGKTVENVEQDNQQVTAHFSDGSSNNYDLLVGADGQGSRIRKAIRADSPSPYRRLGVHMAYWFIPREQGDTNIRHTCILPGGRMIMRRSHSPTESQVYFFLRDDDPELSSIPRASVEKQKEFWTRKFQGGGWQIDRFLEGMKTTTNWYCQEVVQVHIDSWHKGRIALLADAAHCASPFSGMGTTGSLVGAYVLAGEITQNADNLPRALENYERTLRPFVKEIQELNPAAIQLALPESQWGVKIILFLAKICCWLRIPELLVRIMPEKKGGWELPEYPELQRGQ